MLTVQFDLHRTSPNQRACWQAMRRRRQALANATFYGWLMAGSPVVLGPVRISLTVRRGRVLDPDNAISASKQLLDALVSYHVIEGDSAKHLSIGEVRQETGARWKGREQIVVTIEPRERDGD